MNRKGKILEFLIEYISDKKVKIDGIVYKIVSYSSNSFSSDNEFEPTFGSYVLVDKE